MFTIRSQRARAVGVLGAIIMAVVIGAWTLPSGGEAAHAGQARTLSVDINWPVGDIQSGQFCTGSALVSNYTPPITFTWSGQFDNSYASHGSDGDNQIVSGNTSNGRPAYLKVTVTDANTTQTDSVAWSWGDFNDECAI